MDLINDYTSQVFSGTASFFVIVLYLVYAVALWKVFTKAGYLGILALIPIVNVIILVRIAGMTGWLALLYLIPVVGWVFSIIVAVKEGANFGKGGVFSFFLLWMFPFIGHFIIGFGSARYRQV